MKPKSDNDAVEVNAESIAQALERSDDFGFEMRVRALLELHSRDVQHSASYRDPVEQKPRQFDFRCSIRAERTKEDLAVWLAVECKNLSAAAPLIISGTLRTHEESFHHWIVVKQGSMGLDRKGFTTAGSDATYPHAKFVGKSILRLKPEKGNLSADRQGESEIYGRWSQALASAASLCEEVAFPDSIPTRSTLSLVLPIVIVPDGTLWTVEYANHGDSRAVPQSSDSASFFVNHRVEIGGTRIDHFHLALSHVHFLTFSGFLHFLDKLDETDHNPSPCWHQWFPAVNEPISH